MTLSFSGGSRSVCSRILVVKNSPVSISNTVTIGRSNPLKQKLCGESTIILKRVLEDTEFENHWHIQY